MALYSRVARSSWRHILLAALLLAAPFTALGDDSSPKGSYAGKSAGRCGAFTGSQAVEESKAALSETAADSLMMNLVVCEKHLRQHKTSLVHKRVDGTDVKYPVFADSADMPDSSAAFDLSASSKSSSDSSPAVSSASSDSVAPELTTVSFVAELNPTPNGRRHMLQAFVTAVPTDEEVADINEWLGDFAEDNSDVVDGRDSITATSFKRGTGGVIFFTVFILTSNPAVVEARVVALPEYSSPAGDAVLTEPQPCGNGEDVRFGAAEDLTAQLSVAPPPGCANPLDPVVVTSAPNPPPAQVTTTPSATTTPSETTTPMETTTPISETTTPGETTTPSETTTPGETTTPSETTTPMETSTPISETTTPGETTTPISETTTPGETTTPSETTTPGETTTPVQTTTPGETTTVDPCPNRRRLLLGDRKLLGC